MKWLIPAKTFFVGEYAALDGGSALILTTSPCFELKLCKKEGLQGIHSESPGGRYWGLEKKGTGLEWINPYIKDGVGSSSAQFLAVYLATCYLKNSSPNFEEMLTSYYDCAWQGQGPRPSGYDLIAQAQQQCVYINRKRGEIQNYDWPFKDLGFLLIHSGNKLATHHHLQALRLPRQLDELSALVEQAKQAFDLEDSERIIVSVNDYHDALAVRNLVAQQSINQIERFKQQKNILAVKGCGAMGADVFLLIVELEKLTLIQQDLAEAGWFILASNQQLYKSKELIEGDLLGVSQW